MIFLICRRTIILSMIDLFTGVYNEDSLLRGCNGCNGCSIVMKFSFIFILIMYLFLFQRDLIYYLYNEFKDLFTALILCFHRPRGCRKLFVLSTIEVNVICYFKERNSSTVPFEVACTQFNFFISMHCLFSD